VDSGSPSRRGLAPTLGRVAEPSGSARLLGVDAARGLALLGMMAVHVLPGEAADGAVTTPHLVAGGRSAAAFAVLAGVGLALTSGGPRPPTGRRWAGIAAATVVRALAIGLVGLWLGRLDSGVAVILAYYAVLFLLAVPLLRLGPRVLALAAASTAVLVPAGSAAARAGLPSPDRANPTAASLVADPGARLLELTLTGYYPALAWTAYLCAGLAVGRLPLHSLRVAWGLLALGSGVAAASIGVSALLLGPLGGLDRLAAITGTDPAVLAESLQGSQFGTTPTGSWWWLAVDAPHSSTPLDLLHTTGTALAVLGAMLLLARVAAPVLAPLAAAGSMTLSLYAAHVAWLSSDLLPGHPVRSYLLQVLAALVLATAWRRAAPRGPLETLVAAAATPVRRAVDPARRAPAAGPALGPPTARGP
jgi:uncharacterized membrane protein